MSSLDFLRAFYGNVGTLAGLENPLGVRLPYGVTVTQRQRGAGEGEAEKEPGSVVFVMNFGHGPAEISVPGAWRDAESGESCGAALCLEPLSCRILERED